MLKLQNIKIAIVYDRVNKWGGAERVLLALHEIFPQAPLYTSVYDKKRAPWAKVFPKVYTSFLQKFPFTRTNHEFLGTLMPLAFESFDFREYDIVTSVTSEAAKGIKTRPGTLHICYCLTHTRYLWSAHDFYFRNPPVYFKPFPFFWQISRPFVAFLRWWDVAAAKRPDKMIAISGIVKERIKKYYHRDSQVIFPPVEVKNIRRRINQNRSYYLVVNRLVPYKRVDLAVLAFNRLGFPLVIVGEGSERNKLAHVAKRNIKFVGEITEKELLGYYENAKALIVPQEEDFGIVAVEAQAAGTPVIAFAKGGAVDTVIDGKTGVFFHKQEVESLSSAIAKFEKMRFNRNTLVNNAKRFSKAVFKKKFLIHI